MAEEAKSVARFRAAIEDASALGLAPEFERAQCLMNPEVVIILQKKLEHYPSSQLSQTFVRFLQYAKKCSRYQNPDAVDQVRTILVRNNLSKYEATAVGNLCPVAIEEAKTLVPSLGRKGRLNDDQIRAIINDLAHIKTFE